MLQLTQPDFEKLVKLSNSIKDKSLDEGEYKKAFLTGFDKTGKYLLDKIIRPYIENLIGNYSIHIAMVSEAFLPWSIHTDYNKGDEHPGHAILIPLETVNAHTIIFNEECLTEFKLDKINIPKIENNCVHLHKTILSHIPEHALEHVSIQKIENWVEGKIIIWDRKLLHASDNFNDVGINTKKSVIIFTSKVQNIN